MGFIVRRVTSALAVVVGALTLAQVTMIATAGADGATTAKATTAFYLDIGGSASLGVQPNSTDPHDERTNRGYANDLVALMASKGLTLTLDQTGCSGETTSTMLSGADKCYASPDSQLAEAIAFLSAHHDETGLVTIDLGFNDFVPCLRGMTVNDGCVDTQLPLIQQQLPEILTDLKAAAGPNVSFVGVGHYNPYLADAVRGAKGVHFSNASSGVVRMLNNDLGTIYRSFGIPMADVAKQFSGATKGHVFVPGFGIAPPNVARVCALTWMCNGNAAPANIHPDDAGYAVIAAAIAAVLPPNL
ncbi:MAG TPA: SGNH/GDSL hydrolase family protein [Acidimicrobiales bacterium]